MRFIFIIILLSSCANPFKKDNSPQDPVNFDRKAVEDKLAIYIEEEELITGMNGFTDFGDGMLFSCLKFASGGDVDWKSAHYPGDEYRMIRSPTWAPPKSTDEKWSYYSKDMFVGELVCAWTARDLDYIEHRIQWLEDHKWDMCGGRDGAEPYESWLTRCKVSLNLKDTIYEMRDQLGGDGHPSMWVPQIWNPSTNDFPAHLNVVHIALRGVMIGGINDIQLAYLKAKSEANPVNGLYSAVYHLFLDGDMQDPYQNLMNELYFPPDFLPTTRQYCTHYLFQRAQFKDGSVNPDWDPCPLTDIFEVYHGVDFMFAATILLGNFK